MFGIGYLNNYLDLKKIQILEENLYWNYIRIVYFLVIL